MILGAKSRQWLSREWLVSSGGGYFILGLSVMAIIASVVLLLSTHTYHLYFKADPKVEAHLAECEGCRHRSIGVVWNHLPPTSDRESLIQSHLDACAACQQKVLSAVHDHAQLQSPLGKKSRLGVPLPSQAR